MVNSDRELRKLVEAIVECYSDEVSRLLGASPELARASFKEGATRQSEKPFFLDRIRRYVWRGYTALHIAAAGYQAETVCTLIAAGADIHAGNRHGDEPIHAAAVGNPSSPNCSSGDARASFTIGLCSRGPEPCKYGTRAAAQQQLFGGTADPC